MYQIKNSPTLPQIHFLKSQSFSVSLVTNAYKKYHQNFHPIFAALQLPSITNNIYVRKRYNHVTAIPYPSGDSLRSGQTNHKNKT